MIPDSIAHLLAGLATNAPTMTFDNLRRQQPNPRLLSYSADWSSLVFTEDDYRTGNHIAWLLSGLPADQPDTIYPDNYLPNLVVVKGDFPSPFTPTSDHNQTSWVLCNRAAYLLNSLTHGLLNSLTHEEANRRDEQP